MKGLGSSKKVGGLWSRIMWIFGPLGIGPEDIFFIGFFKPVPYEVMWWKSFRIAMF